MFFNVCFDIGWGGSDCWMNELDKKLGKLLLKSVTLLCKGKGSDLGTPAVDGYVYTAIKLASPCQLTRVCEVCKIVV